MDAAKKKIDEEYANRGMKTQIKGARDALEDLLERSADSIIGERMSNNIILALNHQVTTDHPVLLYLLFFHRWG